MKEKWWICERRMRACKTILVSARSRKEAQEILDDGKGESFDVAYYDIQRARVIRKSKD